MDEPLSNLDAKLRVSMRNEITKLHRDLGATTIYVTHDQVEAMTMADRIVVMKDGFIQQIAPPMDLYNNPANLFVATFIGAPQMNILNVKISGGYVKLENRQEIILPEGVLKQLAEIKGELIMGIRPEHVSINGLEIENFSDQVVKAEITNLERMGYNNQYLQK